MRKKYSIGFFAGIIILILLFMLAYRISYKKALDKQQMEEKQMVQNKVEICYYIQEHEGYVIVLESDRKTVYEYTSILVEDLPEYVQEQVKTGMRVTSLTQVYGFLENYSS